MRNFKDDFLSGAPELSAFYPYLSGLPPLKTLTERKATAPVDRTVLVKALHNQYSGMDLPAAVRDAINSLAESTTFTVTTGHQLCLGTGPLFMILKILTVIRQAEEWTRQNPGTRIVPVFWMASEDHDFAEANHFYPNPETKISYPGQWKGPVGRLIIGAEMASLELPGELEWIRRFFVPGITWARAFRTMLHHLFGKYGLVILDGDDPDLKRSFLPVIEAELKNGLPAERLRTHSEQYGETYPVQAFAREVNLFWLKENQRLPLKRNAEGTLTTPDGESPDLNSIRPEDFSPSALLRPLYQEWVLPNLAYTGGWAELAYWMQCGGLFKAYKTPFPALIPRFTATLVPQAVAKGVSDWTESPDVLEQALLESLWPTGPWKDQSRLVLENFDRLGNLVNSVDQSLIRTLEGEKHKLQTFLQEQFPKKIRKQLRNRYADQFRPIDQFRSWILPGGDLQERVLNVGAFGSPEGVIEFLYQYQGLYPGKPALIRLP